MKKPQAHDVLINTPILGSSESKSSDTNWIPSASETQLNDSLMTQTGKEPYHDKSQEYTGVTGAKKVQFADDMSPGSI